MPAPLSSGDQGPARPAVPARLASAPPERSILPVRLGATWPPRAYAHASLATRAIAHSIASIMTKPSMNVTKLALAAEACSSGLIAVPTRRMTAITIGIPVTAKKNRSQRPACGVHLGTIRQKLATGAVITRPISTSWRITANRKKTMK